MTETEEGVYRFAGADGEGKREDGQQKAEDSQTICRLSSVICSLCHLLLEASRRETR
jgi:hypothetical protein